VEQRTALDLAAEIRTLQTAGHETALRELLEQLHPADLAEVLEELDEADRAATLQALDAERAAMAVEALDVDDQVVVLRLLDRRRVSEILSHMSNDDVADLLGDLPPEEAGQFLGLMEREEARDIRELLQYPEDTAGGIMTTEFVSVPAVATAAQTIDLLRRLAPDAETAYYVYVVDEQGRLAGVLSLRDLIVAPPETSVGAIMNPNVISVTADTDQEEVARQVSKYDFLAMPVVDAERRLLGIVTFDDVMDVLEEEATEDIYLLGAAGVEEDVDILRLGPWKRATRRLPWLVLLLFGQLVAANVIAGFSSALEAMVALAYFIPILAGMGGNVGTQSLAVAVRGLATGELSRRDIFRALMVEIQTGLLLGVSTGTLIFLVALAWQGIPLLGLVVGLAMTLSMTVAALVGTLVPMVLERFGVDPAVASGPFVTTSLDVTGLFIYLGLATVFLRTVGLTLAG